MKKFLDGLAYVIVFVAVGSVLGLIGYAMYTHPDISLPLVIGLGVVFAFVWAMDRIDGVF